MEIWLSFVVFGIGIFGLFGGAKKREEETQRRRQTFHAILEAQFSYVDHLVFSEEEAEEMMRLAEDDYALAFKLAHSSIIKKGLNPETGDYVMGERQPNIKEGLEAQAELDELRAEVASVQDVRAFEKYTEGADVLMDCWRAVEEDGGMPVYVPESTRTRHTYVVGKSGSGKTTLLTWLAFQDIWTGRGVAFMTPEAETLMFDLMPFVPENRLSDVVYINPEDEQCRFYINPFYLRSRANFDRQAANVYTMLERLMEGEMSPRIGQILRQAVHALLEVPNSSILDIPKLLDRRDGSFRESILNQLRDPDTKQFWSVIYEEMPRNAHVAIMTRLAAFVRPRYIRNILGRRGPGVDFRELIDGEKILLCNLSDGRIGETASRLLGGLIVSQLQLASLSRADSPGKKHPLFFVYLDEFQSFVSAGNVSYDRLLSRSRKYGMPLILAHQQTGQLPSSLVAEILGNVSTSVVFNVGRDDANRMIKEFVRDDLPDGMKTNPEQILSLPIGQCFARIGRVAFPMSVEYVLDSFNELRDPSMTARIADWSKGAAPEIDPTLEMIRVEPPSTPTPTVEEKPDVLQPPQSPHVRDDVPPSPFPDDYDVSGLF